MPAGPRYLYYGLGLGSEDIFKIVDPESYLVCDCDEKHKNCMNEYIDWDYLDILKKILKKSDFTGDITCYGESFPSLKLNNKITMVYGFKLAEYGIFENIEFDSDVSNYKEDLNKFKLKYNLLSKPKYYSFYSGG